MRRRHEASSISANCIGTSPGRCFSSDYVRPLETIVLTDFRNWPFARVLVLSGGWVLLCILPPLTWLLFQFNDVVDVSSGSGGIGAVSFGFSALMLAIPIAPPIILTVAWLIARVASKQT